jgi:hypothetical protein
MPPTLSRADLVALPKAPLHLHLEDAMRPSTAGELAERYRTPPTSGPYHGLAGFVREHETARDLIRSLADLARVAAEIVADAARQGVAWTENHCVPFNYGGRFGPAEAIVEAVLGSPARARTGTSRANLILAHNRAAGHDLAERVMTLATRYRAHGVVGFRLGRRRGRQPARPVPRHLRRGQGSRTSIGPARWRSGRARQRTRRPARAGSGQDRPRGAGGRGPRAGRRAGRFAGVPGRLPDQQCDARRLSQPGQSPAARAHPCKGAGVPRQRRPAVLRCRRGR